MNETLVIKETRFKAIRSGGPGGQHANKVSSKVVGIFDLEGSRALSDSEKLRIKSRLGHRLSAEGELKLSCDSSRSQHKNKAVAAERLIGLLRGALKEQRKRVPTKVSRNEKARRLESKRKQSEKKERRRPPEF